MELAGTLSLSITSFPVEIIDVRGIIGVSESLVGECKDPRIYPGSDMNMKNTGLGQLANVLPNPY